MNSCIHFSFLLPIGEELLPGQLFGAEKSSSQGSA
jgi:hypothetical protein